LPVVQSPKFSTKLAFTSANLRLVPQVTPRIDAGRGKCYNSRAMDIQRREFLILGAAGAALAARAAQTATPIEQADFRYGLTRVNDVLAKECARRGITITDWHIHLRGGMTAEMAAEREKASGIRSGVLENHGREWPLRAAHARGAEEARRVQRRRGIHPAVRFHHAVPGRALLEHGGLVGGDHAARPRPHPSGMVRGLE